MKEFWLNKYVLKRTFLNLLQGDTISFTVSSYNEIFVKVENRMRDVHKAGKWTKEEINPFTAMELRIPETPKDTTKEFTLLYSPNEWMNIQVQEYIKQLQDAGVI